MPTVTFTSGAGSWTVPAGVTSLDVAADGGGAAYMAAFQWGGGGSARAASTITVTPGQTVWYAVGGVQTNDGFYGNPSWLNNAANAAPTIASNGVHASGGGNNSGEGSVNGGSGFVGQSLLTGGDADYGPPSNGGSSAGGGAGATATVAAQTPGGGGSAAFPNGARGEVRITYTAAVTRRPIRLVALR